MSFPMMKISDADPLRLLSKEIRAERVLAKLKQRSIPVLLLALVYAIGLFAERKGRGLARRFRS